MSKLDKLKARQKTIEESKADYRDTDLEKLSNTSEPTAEVSTSTESSSSINAIASAETNSNTNTFLESENNSEIQLESENADNSETQVSEASTLLETPAPRDLPKQKRPRPAATRNRRQPTGANGKEYTQTCYMIKDINIRFLSYEASINDITRQEFFDKFINTLIQEEKKNPTKPSFSEAVGRRRKNTSDLAPLTIIISLEAFEFIKNQSRKKAQSAAAYLDECLDTLREKLT